MEENKNSFGGVGDFNNDANESSSSGGGGSFDGKIKEWPSTTLVTTNVPKEEKDFIVYIASEIFKNQMITNAAQQAKESINCARTLYNQLKRYGYL